MTCHINAGAIFYFGMAWPEVIVLIHSEQKTKRFESGKTVFLIPDTLITIP